MSSSRGGGHGDSAEGDRGAGAGPHGGLPQSCTDETGQLLAVLASSMRDAPILEIGSGFGVGTAWLASTARVRVVTAEQDPERARGVRALMRDVPGVVVVHGDWAEALPHGPFGLIFVDAKVAKHDAVDTVIGAMIAGGLVLLDDLTPKEKWPTEWVGQPDALRDLAHPPEPLGGGNSHGPGSMRHRGLQGRCPDPRHKP